jgi:hypothetical protein
MTEDELREFVRVGKIKQAIYEAYRREHTNRMRGILREQRDGEVTWTRIICEPEPCADI